ncbi:MAG TPA: PhnD/SsuA/transferrin family substrate-binding protein, partial [Acidobacteriaceae bacterium]
MRTLPSRSLTFARWAIFTLAVAQSTGAFSQNAAARAAGPQARLLLAIDEGGAANADSSETFRRHEEFSRIVGKVLGSPVTIVAVRDRNLLLDALKKQSYALLFARPNDVPAQAIRDYGYQPVVTEKEPARALFIVKKDSPLKSIADVKGSSILTPDRYSSIWRVANAMLRDNKISMANEKVRTMHDDAAIGWSLESGFFDVGVINSISGVGRTWEKNGGRVIARSPDLPNMPLIASPELSAAQVVKLRAALVALNSSQNGRAVLKRIGLTGFRETSSQEFLDFLKWLGD